MKNIRFGLSIVLVAVVAVFAAGCGSHPSAPQKKDPAQVSHVEDSDFAGQQRAEQAETRARNQKGPAFAREELLALMADPRHAPHLKLWRDIDSYYALLEISEGIIQPEIGRIRRQDIQELLGKGNPDYPNSNGKLLEYGGDRQIPYASHLLIHFDDKDVVDTVEWVSE